MKRDIDKAKRDRADEKRERRQRHVDQGATAVAPAAPAAANDELLIRLQQVHAQFDAHEIGFEEFERAKNALLARLATD
jgi:hypothetical protein